MNETGKRFEQRNKKAFWILGVLVIVFFGPMIAAWSLYQTREFVPETVTHGHLIKKPLQMRTLQFTDASNQVVSQKVLSGKWLLMYVSPKQCDKLCQENLYKIRQIRKMLGKNMNRVERVLVSTEGDKNNSNLNKLMKTRYEGTIQLFTRKSDLQHFLKPLPSHTLAMQEGYLYVVDPLGNVMMSYKPLAKPRGIYKDMKRLLMASNIG